MKKSSHCFSIILSLLFLGVFSFSFFFPKKPEEPYNHCPQWLHSQDPHHPLLTINLSNITKLSSTNYLTWSLQIQSFLEGYDLHHFIDGAILHHHPPLPSLVLHPQIRHTQPENVKIVSSLVLSLVLSPFHYNRLLPAPPLPLMHGNLSQYLCQTISWSY